MPLTLIIAALALLLLLFWWNRRDVDKSQAAHPAQPADSSPPVSKAVAEPPPPVGEAATTAPAVGAAAEQPAPVVEPAPQPAEPPAAAPAESIPQSVEPLAAAPAAWKPTPPTPLPQAFSDTPPTPPVAEPASPVSEESASTSAVPTPDAQPVEPNETRATNKIETHTETTVATSEPSPELEAAPVVSASAESEPVQPDSEPVVLASEAVAAAEPSAAPKPTKPARKARAPRKAPARTKAASTKATRKNHTSANDDLTRIEGIGPKINTVLHQADIHTFAQLAAMKPAAIKQLLTEGGVRIGDPATWPRQAKLAAGGKWDQLKTLQGTLKGGRKI